MRSCARSANERHAASDRLDPHLQARPHPTPREGGHRGGRVHLRPPGRESAARGQATAARIRGPAQCTTRRLPHHLPDLRHRDHHCHRPPRGHLSKTLTAHPRTPGPLGARPPADSYRPARCAARADVRHERMSVTLVVNRSRVLSQSGCYLLSRAAHRVTISERSTPIPSATASRSAVVHTESPLHSADAFLSLMPSQNVSTFGFISWRVSSALTSRATAVFKDIIRQPFLQVPIAPVRRQFRRFTAGLK